MICDITRIAVKNNNYRFALPVGRDHMFDAYFIAKNMQCHNQWKFYDTVGIIVSIKSLFS